MLHEVSMCDACRAGNLRGRNNPLRKTIEVAEHSKKKYRSLRTERKEEEKMLNMGKKEYSFAILGQTNQIRYTCLEPSNIEQEKLPHLI
uniref:Gag-pol polyprotein n=1 Tax=Heterorhabditis bacteriophora TaxID=37862 RepID=A0A1I7WW39_HETBA